ncbi:MAG TPA: tetratricopeptide repeat protein, partial [Longimicrobiales bacterium]|nr:tetratricopeptide repeat protein [Longimicrobiales bacterium]
RFGAAEAAYDSILARDPGDPEARLGRARILAISDRLEAAAAEYRAIVEDEPDNLEARQGLARTLTWDGELVQGEEAWEEALEVESRSVPSLVGLAQNLRWQGRNAAALAVLERARARAPRDQEIREEMRWVEAALNPRVETSLVVEDDSDENRMITTTLMARWHPSPRLGLRMDAYRRDAEQRVLDHVAQGLTFSVSYELEPGWGLIGGAGGSESDSERDDAFASWHLSVTSPWRYRVGGSAFVRSSALDATAALVRTGVRMTEFGLSGRWAPAPEWRVDATVGGASLEGVEDNGRVNGTVGVSRDLGRAWRVGLAGRAFSYDEDLSEGYFDPDFYGIVEAPARWLWQPGPWSVLVEAAPGFQQVTSGGEVRGAVRTSARLAYRIAPGREVSASGGLSSTGVQSFSTGASDYRYGAFILSLTWVF